MTLLLSLSIADWYHRNRLPWCIQRTWSRRLSQRFLPISLFPRRLGFTHSWMCLLIDYSTRYRYWMNQHKIRLSPLVVFFKMRWKTTHDSSPDPYTTECSSLILACIITDASNKTHDKHRLSKKQKKNNLFVRYEAASFVLFIKPLIKNPTRSPPHSI